MKKYNDNIKEYVKRLSDEDLKFIGTRLSQRLGGDVGDAVEFVQRQPDMDSWLKTASGHKAFYGLLDQLETNVQQEMKKRTGTHGQKEQGKASSRRR